jgi:hypothetical protein
LDLLDNGSGADRIANDGLYSRYFARWENGDGRYIIKCQVKNTDRSEVNGGFINSRSRFLKDMVKHTKAYPIGGSVPPCCGSNTAVGDVVREPTGEFARQAAGGSMRLFNVPDVNAVDVISPGMVSDLAATRNVTSRTITLSFTSPGDDFDEGQVTNYDIRYAMTVDELLDNFETAEVVDSWIAPGFDLTPVAPLTQKVVRLNYDASLAGLIVNFAMRAVDEAGNNGTVSNVVNAYLEVFEPAPGTTTTTTTTEPPSNGLSGGEIAGIVIGSVLGVFIIVALVYFIGIKKNCFRD